MRVLVFALACACACATPSAKSTGTPSSTTAASTMSSANGPAATAVIEPRSGSTVSGTVKFVTAPGGVGAHVELQGATPGQHGVHVHEKGDCSDPKALSAGPHFNPTTSPHHGGPTGAPRHAGDLGNIEVNSGGTGTLDVVVTDISVAGPQDGIVGRAIVVHEKIDDLATDPAGNSGGRFGCGVIQAAPAGG